MLLWMVVIQRHEHWTFQKMLVAAHVWCMHLLSTHKVNVVNDRVWWGIWSKVRATNGNRTWLEKLH
jgi:hypothetical protein